MKPKEPSNVNSPDKISSKPSKLKTMSDKINVLYIDDDMNSLISFKSNFLKHYTVFTASSAKEGMEILSKEKVHVIVADQRMPEVTGVEFLESIIDRYPEPVRMLLTGYTDMEALVDGVNKAHIYKHLGKPIKEDEVAEAIEEGYRYYCKEKLQQQMITDLTRSNEQLEFMLREKLIS